MGYLENGNTTAEANWLMYLHDVGLVDLTEPIGDKPDINLGSLDIKVEQTPTKTQAKPVEPLVGRAVHRATEPAPPIIASSQLPYEEVVYDPLIHTGRSPTL